MVIMSATAVSSRLASLSRLLIVQLYPRSHENGNLPILRQKQTIKYPKFCPYPNENEICCFSIYQEHSHLDLSKDHVFFRVSCQESLALD